MAYLSDYLGQLMSEISIARSQADFEAIRLAELYANHELLKHFPIPRMRISDLDLDIPIVIIESEGPIEDAGSRGGLSVLEMRERFDAALQRELKLHNIKVDDEGMNSLNISLNSLSKHMHRPKFLLVDTNVVADRFTSDVRKFLKKKEYTTPDKVNNFINSLGKAARLDFLEARPVPPRIRIGATSAEIREAPPEAIVRISIRISEEGLELTQIAPQDDHDEKVRLVPE